MNILRATSLRSQLIRWFLLSVLGLWILFVVVAGGMVWQLFRQQVDHHIHVVLLEVVRVWDEADEEHRNAAIENFVSSQGMIVMVLNSDGDTLLQTTSQDVTLPTQQELRTVLETGAMSTPDHPYHFTAFNTRFASVTVEDGVIAVGYSLEVLYRTLYQILSVVIGLSVVMILGLVLLGGRLVDKALQPIQLIAEAAKAIRASGDLSKRVPATQSSNELQTLSATINEMLASLEKTFDQERQFFSDAAHTLKTPLASLRTQLELSSHQKTLAATREKLVMGMELIDQSSQVVSDLLLLSTMEHRMDSKQISLSKLLRDIGRWAEPLAHAKQVVFTLEIEEGVEITGDKKLLTKAIMNVVENAIRYCSIHDSVTLKLHTNQTSVIIEINDTGPGMSQVEQHKVWERFYRGNSGMKSGSGSGLGMAITKTIIEFHGGNVSLESQMKRGTNISMVLPNHGHIEGVDY